MNPKEFSFPRKSTTHALVYLLHAVLAALVSGQCCVGIFFEDFKKGFDLVDHNFIIEELKRRDVHPSIVRWIHDFFTGPYRPQTMCENGQLLFLMEEK